MSVTSAPTQDLLELPPVPVKRFTVSEYRRMVTANIFADDERFELLEGWIVPKMVRSPYHDAVIDQVQEILRGRLPSGWRVRVQSAVSTADSVPEPDLAIVPGPASRYTDHHPESRDVALVIEVADSSLAQDRSIKKRLYARAGIAVYWIVNLVDRHIEVYTDPTEPSAKPDYRKRQDYGTSAVLPLEIAGQELGPIAVSELLP